MKTIHRTHRTPILSWVVLHMEPRESDDEHAIVLLQLITGVLPQSLDPEDPVDLSIEIPPTEEGPASERVIWSGQIVDVGQTAPDRLVIQARGQATDGLDESEATAWPPVPSFTLTASIECTREVEDDHPED